MFAFVLHVYYNYSNYNQMALADTNALSQPIMIQIVMSWVFALHTH